LTHDEEQYEKQLLDREEGVVPFVPDHAIKEALVALVVMLVVLFFVFFVKYPLEDVADPTSTGYEPRPEWYFLFFFQLLRMFTGTIPGINMPMEVLGTVVVPGVIFLLLFLLPWLDRGKERKPIKRPITTLAGVLALAGIVILTYQAAMIPSTPPAGTAALETEKLTPIEKAGLAIYKQQGCSSCHAIQGVGGTFNGKPVENAGPDLSYVGYRLTAQWILSHITSPIKNMPQFTLNDEQKMELTAYLLTLKAKPGEKEEIKTPVEAGKDLFRKQGCAGCHSVSPTAKPEEIPLWKIGDRFTRDQLRTQILTPRGKMPPYEKALNDKALTEDELQAILDYLLSLK